MYQVLLMSCYILSVGEEVYMGCYFDYTTVADRNFIPRSNTSTAYDCMEHCFSLDAPFASHNLKCMINIFQFYF